MKEEGDAERTRAAIDRVRRVVARLRAPDGCPWDRRQDLASMRHHLLEEAYEVLDAIDDGDAAAHCEELGDLAFQIVFQAQLREEQGEFDLADVLTGIADKLVRRHPHVFGDEDASDPARVARRWEELKRAEGKRPLEAIPRALPALMRAEKIGREAAKVGFDWPDVDGPLDKLEEEVAELREAIAAGDAEASARELGDVLFAAVNVARHVDARPELALAGTTRRFLARFAYILERLDGPPEAATLTELDALWEEAKANLGGRDA